MGPIGKKNEKKKTYWWHGETLKKNKNHLVTRQKESSVCGHFKKTNAQQKQSHNLYSPAGQSLEKLVECLRAAWILLEKQGFLLTQRLRK